MSDGEKGSCTLRDQWFMVHELAVLDWQAGEVAQARAGYQEALRLARELGDKAAQSTELQALGALDLRQGTPIWHGLNWSKPSPLPDRCNNLPSSLRPPGGWRN